MTATRSTVLVDLVTRVVPGAVPVDPDAATARQWARDELAKPDYQHGESLLARLIDWFRGLFQPVGGGPDLAPVWIVLAACLVVTVGVVALRRAGPLRTTARTTGAGGVLDDDTRTATTIRAAADAAATAGDWTTAVLETFRATVRALEERALLDPRPGRTAHEVADDAAVRLPDATSALAHGAALFDSVRYGSRRVGPAEHASMRAVDDAVAGARPVAVTVPATSTAEDGS